MAAAQLATCPSCLGSLSPRSAFDGAARKHSLSNATSLSSTSTLSGVTFRGFLKRTHCQKGQDICSGVLRSALGVDVKSEEEPAENRRVLTPTGVKRVFTSAAAAVLSVSLLAGGISPAEARPAGVNRPELLPKNFTPVIDVAGFLSEGQEKRLEKDLKRLEEDTGFKLRVLAQNYPETPGLAVKDYWKVDDRSIVFVADPSLGGNILNFNVGAEVDLAVPKSFWSRLSGKYGNKFFWQEKGEDASIEAAVIAIDACLREPPGPRACSNIQ